MNVNTQLLKGYISDYITKGIDDFDIDADKICNTLATEVLKRIHNVILQDDLSDIDAMEEIIEIMEEYNIYCGSRHDY